MKLESLKDFQSNVIEKEKMSNFFGGIGGISPSLAEAWGNTKGSEICAAEHGINSGSSCATYTSDYNPGNGGAITLIGLKDTDKPC